MKSELVAEVLLKYLRDVIYSRSNEPQSVLNIDDLPEDFQELGRGLQFFAECVTETRKFAGDLSKGILNNELPSRENEIAAPLKSLHASLKHLTWQTQQIAHGDYSQCVDFMGEFSASFNKMIEQLAVRDSLLKTVNNVAAALLSVDNERPFEASLAESMEHLGKCINIDRMHIFQSGISNGHKGLFHSYEWNKENEDEEKRLRHNKHFPYEAFPMWESTILHGEILHGPYSAMPPDIQEFFDKVGIKSIVTIPLFLHGEFWGIFSLDCKTERTFSEEEIYILQSAALMMISAIIRHEALDKVNEEHEKAGKLAHWYHSILDAIPLPISVTDTEMKWTFINQAVENFLGTKRKDMLGKSCSNWGADICNTAECGIACVKRGKKQTYFTHNDSSFKVDIETLNDINGNMAGFIEIVQDVTEIEKIAKLHAEAETANRAKSIFLTNMSHEMRTPMSAILGVAEIQLQNKILSEDTAYAFGRIYESGDLLLNIINDILDLSKIEAGKMELVPVNYDIPSLINDTVQLNCLRYENRPVEFFLQVDENTPYNLYGDEIRIKQVLNNILSNAFKYTDSGRIEFTVSAELEQTAEPGNATIVFRVSDTGRGMTEEQVAGLFDEYTRYNIEANREKIGTGLGMNITKNLVDLMNGSISVRSEIDKGSVFTVRIPQKRIDMAVCGSELAGKLNDFRYQSMEIAKKGQFIREYMPYGSVLIVDDVESNIYVANGMLSLYGLKIDTASSGFEAIEKIKNGNIYDIVFIDHMMPKMDGIEATKILRDMGYHHTIIALTANALIGQERMFLSNGFDGFVSKPIDSREMNHVLNEFIRNRKAPEVVKAARLEQQEKERNNTADSANNTEISDKLTAAAIHDFENALAVLEELLPKINTERDELKLFTTTVHGLKSALANIGEMQLSDTARRLENAAAQLSTEFPAHKGETTALLEETNRFMNTLRLFIEKIKPPKSARTDGIAEISRDDILFMQDKLNYIKTACEKFMLNDAKAALSDLKQKTWPDKINDSLNEISIYLIRGECKNVVSVADKVMEEYDARI